MKKLIAFISICCFSLLLKDQTAICRSNCNIPIIKSLEKNSNTPVEVENPEHPLRPYDGFFIKL